MVRSYYQIIVLFILIHHAVLTISNSTHRLSLNTFQCACDVRVILLPIRIQYLHMSYIAMVTLVLLTIMIRFCQAI